MSKIAFLFPGQGSQYVGMGVDLLKAYEFASPMLQKAEDVCGIDIRKLCVKGPLEDLTRTANLQPCLTAIDIICAKALMEEGIQPDAVAGHSLGEYPALWACGAVDFRDCLRLVKERGRVMEAAAQRRPGSMAAIIGLEAQELKEIIDGVLSQHKGVLAMANHNSKEQIVVTGEKALVKSLCEKVKTLGKRAIMLRVSGAYHSPLMEGAAKEFARVLSSVSFGRPSIPIYSNVSANPEEDPAMIVRLLSQQMCMPVRWYEIANNMYRDGVRIFIEAGPKKVLSNLIKKSIDADDYQVFSVETKADIDSIKNAFSI